MPRQRRERAEPEGPSKAWLDSYADAMTLLLAFFIMMFAFALVDEEKFLEFKFGVAQALGEPLPATEHSSGILGDGTGLSDDTGLSAVLASDPEDKVDAAAERLGNLGEVTYEDVETLEEVLRGRFEQAGVGDDVTVSSSPRGVTVRFEDEVLFPSGSAELTVDGQAIMGTTAAVLHLIDNQVLVEGHTDSVPTRGEVWPTNWELSTGRATAVVRLLAEGFRIHAPRLSATGFADTRPRGSNTTAAGRQANRRVEVTVVVEPAPVPGAVDAAIREIDLVGDLLPIATGTARFERSGRG